MTRAAIVSILSWVFLNDNYRCLSDVHMQVAPMSDQVMDICFTSERNVSYPINRVCALVGLECADDRHLLIRHSEYFRTTSNSSCSCNGLEDSWNVDVLDLTDQLYTNCSFRSQCVINEGALVYTETWASHWFASIHFECILSEFFLDMCNQEERFLEKGGSTLHIVLRNSSSPTKDSCSCVVPAGLTVVVVDYRTSKNGNHLAANGNKVFHDTLSNYFFNQLLPVSDVETNFSFNVGYGLPDMLWISVSVAGTVNSFIRCNKIDTASMMTTTPPSSKFSPTRSSTFVSKRFTHGNLTTTVQSKVSSSRQPVALIAGVASAIVVVSIAAVAVWVFFKRAKVRRKKETAHDCSQFRVRAKQTTDTRNSPKDNPCYVSQSDTIKDACAQTAHTEPIDAVVLQDLRGFRTGLHKQCIPQEDEASKGKGLVLKQTVSSVLYTKPVKLKPTVCIDNYSYVQSKPSGVEEQRDDYSHISCPQHADHVEGPYDHAHTNQNSQLHERTMEDYSYLNMLHFTTDTYTDSEYNHTLTEAIGRSRPTDNTYTGLVYRDRANDSEYSRVTDRSRPTDTNYS